MQSTADPRPIKPKAWAITLLIVVSLALPAAIVVGSIVSILARKPFSNNSASYRSIGGAIKNGEFWFRVGEIKLRWFLNDDSFEQVHLKCLDLETGIERDPGIVAGGDLPGRMASVRDELYFFDDLRVFQLVDDKVVSLGTKRSMSNRILGAPFDYDGDLSVVETAGDDRYRMSHWKGDRWVDGREIVFPKLGQVWCENAQRGRKTLSSINAGSALRLKKPTEPMLEVIQDGENTHLLFRRLDDPFVAYRNGFEFADCDSELASAIAPQNARREPTGWEPIPLLPEYSGTDGFADMFYNQDGPHFMVWTNWKNRHTIPRFFRREADGQHTELSQEFDRTVRLMNLRCPSVHVNPATSTTYLVRCSQNETGATSISRIDRTSVHLPHVFIAGAERDYILEWVRFGIATLFAWIVHVSVLAAGVFWFSRSPIHTFGATQVAIASVFRRIGAFAVDFALVLTAPIAVFALNLSEAVQHIQWPTQLEWFNSLYHIELTVYWFLQRPRVPYFAHITNPIRHFLESLPINRDVLIAMFGAFAVAYIVKLFVEGHCGITPGKWLFGVRTLRSTLRPPGFARALLRDTLLVFDVPMLVTPIPAAISMMLSEQGQRLGDRAADTVVIQVDRSQVTTAGNIRSS